MQLLFIARSADVVGKVLVSYMAIRVHHRVWLEHKIDQHVFDEMRKEQRIGFVGIGFILFAYVLEAIDLYM